VFSRVLVRLIAFLLIAESMFVAMHVATLVRQIEIYEPVAVLLIVLRGLLAALQFTGGWTLAQRKPQGRMLAMYGLIGGALLTPIDIGLGLAPSPIYAWWRWHAVGIYVVYALAAVAMLRAATQSSSTGR
jgi:hypothetical protein